MWSVEMISNVSSAEPSKRNVISGSDQQCQQCWTLKTQCDQWGWSARFFDSLGFISRYYLLHDILPTTVQGKDWMGWTSKRKVTSSLETIVCGAVMWTSHCHQLLYLLTVQDTSITALYAHWDLWCFQYDIYCCCIHGNWGQWLYQNQVPLCKDYGHSNWWNYYPSSGDTVSALAGKTN